MKPINTVEQRPVYRTDEKGARLYALKPFSLEEHLDDFASAVVAQAEWSGMGFYCHREPDEANMVYYIWVGPKRKRQVKLLPGEKIKRHKGMRISFEKRRALKVG